MNLLFVSNLFPDRAEPYRGLDNATLLHALRDLDPGLRVRVVSPRATLPWAKKVWAPRDADAVLRPEYVPAPYLPKIGAGINPRLMASALGPRLDRLDPAPDAVLVSWLFPDACAVAPWAAERGIPLVAIAQGSDVHQYLKSPVRRRAILGALAGARATVTRSGDLRAMLVGAGADEARVHAIYNGVDPATFHPGDRVAERRRLGLPQDRPVLLYVGNFYAVKNPLGLIAAHRGVPGAELVMVGGGPLEREARRQAEGRVRFAGRKGAGEIAAFMRASDLLCIPSHYEGLPNVLLEAFASGLPVVSTAVGGIPELLKPPALGRLVPPGDAGAMASAIREALADPPDREAVAARGREFSWRRTAEAYRALLGGGEG